MKKTAIILPFFLFFYYSITIAQPINQEKLIQTAKNEKKNYHKRMEAIKYINDQNVLCDLAKHDSLLVIRVAAIKQLSDQSILADIAKNDEYIYIRERAVENISDQDILNEFATKDKSGSIRLIAVEKISDPSVLTEIIKTDPNKEVCQKALDKLVPDEEKSIEIVRNCMFAEIREQVLDEIHDELILKEIVETDPDWIIRGKAFIKIKDKKLLSDIAKAKLPTISDLKEGIIVFEEGDKIAETFRTGTTLYGIVENSNNFSIAPQKNETVIIEWNNSDYVYGEKLKNMSELAVLRLGNDQEYLTDISKNAFHRNSRYFALKLLTDDEIINNPETQETLADIAGNDDFEHVRIAAIEKISNQKILNGMVKKDEDNRVQDAIKKRLEEISK